MAKEIYRIEIPIVANDEYSDAIKKAEREVKKILKKLEKNKVRIDVDTKEVEKAEKKLSQLERTARRKGDLQVRLRDRASRGLQAVQQGWERLGRSRVATLAVNAHDRASSVLRGVGRVVTSIPTMISIGIGVVGAAKATAMIKDTIGKAMQSAMDWEVNEVAMMHRLNDDEKAGKHWMKEIGMLADKTPYSSPDLIPAYTQGLTLSKRDPAKAFDYTKIAADMAALTPGRTPEDAMSALLGASMGNYAMLEAYGFKITQETAKQMGGFKGVFKAVVDEYQGGAAKLSQTNAGIISTLQGYQGSLRRSFGQGLLKPIGTELEKVSQFIDDNQDGWGRTKDVVSSVGLAISTGIVDRIKGTTGYLSGLSDMMMQGIEIKRDDQGTITNADEIGQQALQNLKDTKDQVLADLSAWWDTTGKPKAVEVGTALGEGAVNALIAGIPMIGSAIYEAVKGAVVNAVQNPSVGSIGGAALALGGVGMLGMGVGKKVVGAGRGLMGAGRWIGDKAGGLMGGMRGIAGRRQTKYRPDVARRTNTANEMERARKYSQTPQAYRPPKEAKSMYNTGFAKGGPMAGNLFGGAGRALKGVGGKLPGLNLLFGAYDATRGWKDAGNIMGKTNDQLTMLDKAGSGAAKVLEGLTFGFVKAEKVVDKFTGGASAERRTQLEQQQLGYADTKISERDASIGQHSYISDETREKNWQLLEGAPAVKETSEMLVRTMSEITIGLQESFEPMLQSGNVLSATFDMVADVFEESVYGVGETFNSINEKGPIIGEMFDNFKLIMDDITRSLVDTHVTLLDIPQKLGVPFENVGLIATEITGTLALTNAALMQANDSMAVPLENMGMLSTEATGHLALLNASLSTDVPLFASNMTLINDGLTTAYEHIMSGFEPIPPLASDLHGALSTLAQTTHSASSHMSVFNTIGTQVSAVNSALMTLANKIRNVQVQQSINFSAPTAGGPVRAYAKGGIATSPHIGLVAEAGVPEAMIPFDGSQRSKDLWTATGHALGMFDTSTAFDTGVTPVATNEAGGNAISVTVPINVVQDADTDAIIQATLNKVAKELREVLETTT